MSVVVTKDESMLLEHEWGDEVKLVEYIGRVDELQRGPQAFTSTTPEHFVFPPHYHLADQCQVFIDGSAKMPAHDVVPVTLHYADAYTPYGPIEVGKGGLTYFNFRSRADVGAQYMPESRKQIAIKGGREIAVSCRLGLGVEVETLRLETLIDLQEDNLAAYEMIAAPGVQLIDSIAAGSGRFLLVLDGELELAGKTLSKHSVAYAAAGDRFGRRVAGPAGAHVVEIQFPHE
jgi:hypothetical protein